MAKKLTKRERRLQTHQQNLKLLIGGIVVSLILLCAFIFCLCEYITGSLTHNQAQEKNYTFASFKNEDGKNYVYVEQEETPLLITSITMNKTLLETLEDLEQGTDIHCYVIETRARGFDYEIVELEAGSLLLSLDDYNQRNKSNNLGGVIFLGILMPLSCAVTFLFGFSYKMYNDKLKKKNLKMHQKRG